MTINARRLPKYLDSLQFPVTLYEKNSKIPWKDAERGELELLITLGLVFGAGTWTRLRRIFLDRPSADVVDVLLNTPETDNAGLDLDLMQRMVASRKLVFRERLFTVEGETRIRSGHWCWKHKAV